jgi:KDO2-lipid IV(A) lauroyltransferase
VFEAIGEAAGRIDRPAFRRALEHLELAFKGDGNDAERHRLVRGMFRDLGRNVVDLLRLERMRPETIRALVEFDGLRHLDAVMARGRGVLAVSAHLGNWELLGAALVSRGYPVHVITRPLFDDDSNRMLNAWRRKVGLVVHSREAALLAAARALRAGEIVGALLDQDTHGQGMFVDFFGRPAHVPTALFKLARRFDAAIVPIVIGLDRDGVHRARVLPEIERSEGSCTQDSLRADITAWHRVLEREITRRPTQWPWFHRRWKKRPPGTDVVGSTGAERHRMARETPSPSREVAISR